MYHSLTIVDFKETTFNTPVMAVRYLLTIFEEGKCGYGEAVAWRKNAFPQQLTKRQHGLNPEKNKLYILSEWKNIEAFENYWQQNQSFLECAKVMIQKKNWTFEELKSQEGFEEQIQAVEFITFDQYL